MLHIAVYHGHIELIKYLIKRCHLDIDKKDENGKTPLTIAEECNHERIIKNFKRIKKHNQYINK